MRRLLRVIALLTALCLALLALAACQQRPELRFPAVTRQPVTPTPAWQPLPAAQPTVPGPNDAEGPITLRVAAPVSAATAEALRQLYVGFRNGQLSHDSQMPIGDRFEPGGSLAGDHSIEIEFEFVPLAGVLDGAAWRTLSARGSLPDIFVSGDLGSLAREGALADLASLVDRLQPAAAARLPLFALEALKHNRQVLGIPFRASAPILVWNPALLQRLGVELPTRLDADSLLELLSRTAGRLAEQATLPDGIRSSAIADLRPLLALWPSALDTSLGLAAWYTAPEAGAPGSEADTKRPGPVTDGECRTDHAAVQGVLRLLKQLDGPQIVPASGLSAIGAYDEQTAREAFLDGRAAFLIERSENLPALMLQSRVPVVAQPLPMSGFRKSLAWLAGAPADTAITGLTESGRQPFQLLAWCVSAGTEHPAEAGQLALFLAQDPDAQLLLSRLDASPGWLPLTHDRLIWDRVLSRQPQGDWLQPLSLALYHGLASPSILVPDFRQAVRSILMDPSLFRTVQQTEETPLTTLSRATAKPPS